eukprot:6205029-Pleurochrysis_carterae.AAC.1
MADDLGMGELSYLGSSYISTPAIDELAKSGLSFSNAYAGYTVCAPSRATLFTGRNSGHLAGAPAGWPLLPRLLQDAGYETAAFGKSAPMDVVDPGVPDLQWGLPTTHGFDHFLGQPNQAFCHNMYPEYITVDKTALWLHLNAKHRSRIACMANPAAYNYTTDVFTDAAISWLQSRSKNCSPFFAYLSYTVPHAGGWETAPKFPEQGAPVPSDLQYASRPWPQVERDHAAAIGYLDARIGDVLAMLDSLQLATSTAVFFASDNGPHNEGGHSVDFFGSRRWLRGFKRSYYEGGVRSPSIVRWPGITTPGAVSKVPWAFWDVLPTMLEMAQIPLPTNAEIDGRSIVPTLRGASQPPPRYMYWTWRPSRADDFAPLLNATPKLANSQSEAAGYAARVGKWKAVVQSCAHGEAPSQLDWMELYDLEEDPGEKTDIANLNPGVVQRIKDILSTEKLSCRCYQC